MARVTAGTDRHTHEVSFTVSLMRLYAWRHNYFCNVYMHLLMSVLTIPPHAGYVGFSGDLINSMVKSAICNSCDTCTSATWDILAQ